ncbi:hypothetical protein C0J52_24166 [Blattella germanica]|nr:hypothetical protein C0J52_24166 [Blattella germanica]
MCHFEELSYPTNLDDDDDQQLISVELRHRIAAAVQQVTPDMLQRVWQEIDFRWDVCRMTNGAHIEP